MYTFTDKQYTANNHWSETNHHDNIFNYAFSKWYAHSIASMFITAEQIIYTTTTCVYLSMANRVWFDLTWICLHETHFVHFKAIVNVSMAIAIFYFHIHQFMGIIFWDMSMDNILYYYDKNKEFYQRIKWWFHWNNLCLVYLT